ncbi:MAG TPA: amino acid permease [Vicinamibacteria bacterium]|nr:amino acid permease [Vicinamibacteria bacterium]
MPNPPGDPSATDLKRAIGFWAGVAIVIGSIVGSGIFRTPAEIARVLPSPGIILALWVIFGLVSLCGALTLAELSSLLPRTGGTYVILQKAYGDAAAFTFGWMYLVGAIPASLGAVAMVFAEQLVELSGGSPGSSSPATLKMIAAGIIVVLTAVNVVGVGLATTVQSLFTAIKMAALAALFFLALAAGGWDSARLASEGAVAASGLAQAAAFIIFTYNGWAYLGLVAGEVKDPDRQIRRIILSGMFIVIAFYLATNLMYHLSLPISDIARETVVARRVAFDLFGARGGAAMNAAILASVFGTLCAIVLTNSRVPYALARDGLGFSILGRCHPRFATPHIALMVQGVITVVLIFWLGSFGRLTTYFVLVEWTALVFAIAAVFVLRRTMPDAPRPYRTPGYPWVPLVFVIVVSLFLLGIAWSNAARSDWAPVVGLAISLAGFPAFVLWRSLVRRPASALR